MKALIEFIGQDECRGVVRSATGELHRFTHSGVVDLFRLVTEQPNAVCGAVAADRVIGRGAALLLVKGGIKQVHAFMMSKGARQVLDDAGIANSCDTLVDYIVNRAGTGMCPVEEATQDTTDPDEAVRRIRAFLVEKNIL